MKPTKNNSAQEVQREVIESNWIDSDNEVNNWLSENEGITIVHIAEHFYTTTNVYFMTVIWYYQNQDKPDWQRRKEAKEGNPDNVSREALL